MNNPMYLYNTTFAADEALADKLTMWLKHQFIPEATGEGSPMHSPSLLRIAAQHEPGTVSLALHMYADSTDDINDWYADCGNGLFAQILEQWQGRVVFFSTTLEVLL